MVNKLLIGTFYCNHSKIWNLHWIFRKKLQPSFAAQFFKLLLLFFLGSFIIMDAINNFIWKIYTHHTHNLLYSNKLLYIGLENVKECERMSRSSSSNPTYVSSFYSISESIKMKPFKKNVFTKKKSSYIIKTHEKSGNGKIYLFYKNTQSKIKKYIVEFFLSNQWFFFCYPVC